MEPVVIAALAAVLVVALLIMVSYNRLVQLRNHCNESWADIDTELKRRHELIPNLVSTVKGYAEYERELFEQVARARSASQSHADQPAARAQDERALSGHVRQLFALAESYPDLKASKHFLDLQRELSTTEDRLQRARRFYNANVRDLNTRIEVVPSNIVAGWFNFTKREYFEIEDSAERQVPAVGI